MAEAAYVDVEFVAEIEDLLTLESGYAVLLGKQSVAIWNEQQMKAFNDYLRAEYQAGRLEFVIRPPEEDN
jgi:hypothetical protein